MKYVCTMDRLNCQQYLSKYFQLYRCLVILLIIKIFIHILFEPLCHKESTFDLQWIRDIRGIYFPCVMLKTTDQLETSTSPLQLLEQIGLPLKCAYTVCITKAIRIHNLYGNETVSY